MSYFLGYLLCINIVTFVFRGRDKWQAVAKKWRVSEKTLLGLCAVGGGLGGLLGMQMFRHKTVKGTFLYWFYGIVVVWLVAVSYWLLVTGN